MAKLIVFSNYISNNKHTSNLMQYIATRDGVEFNNSNSIEEETENQKKIIDKLVNEFVYLKEIQEYKDYLNENTKENASNFLTEAFNLIDNKDLSKEIYLKYISERPRVEKINTHGLFNSNGEADIKKELKDIKEHEGTVWTHIMSLQRKDAKRLGYDNLKQWQLLLKSKMPVIAKSMNIELKNLVWNGAFHNEGHHPHVHLVIYSKNNKEGYLNQEGIEKIKSSLMNEIFKEELLTIKQKKTLKRDELKNEFSNILDKFYNSIISKNYNPDRELINEFIELTKMLPSKGKLVYGYQNKEVKKQIDKILKLMLKDEKLNNLYKSYELQQEKLFSYYSGKEIKKKPINKNSNFRSLQNKILSFATSNKDSINNINTLINNASEKTIQEKLNKIDDEMKNIENNFESKKAANNSFDYSKERTDIREENYTNGNEDLNTRKRRAVENIKKNIYKALDFNFKYNPKIKSKLYFLAVLNKQELNKNTDLAIKYKTNEIVELLSEDKNINKYFKEYAEVYKYFETDIENDFKGIQNEIFNYAKEINYKGIKQNIIDCSKNLKKNFNLGKNLNIKYDDYTKKNQQSISYAVKGLVYSIADSLYYGAKEGEELKNNISMPRKHKLRHRREVDYDQEL